VLSCSPSPRTPVSAGVSSGALHLCPTGQLPCHLWNTPQTRGGLNLIPLCLVLCLVRPNFEMLSIATPGGNFGWRKEPVRPPFREVDSSREPFGQGKGCGCGLNVRTPRIPAQRQLAGARGKKARTKQAIGTEKTSTVAGRYATLRGLVIITLPHSGGRQKLRLSDGCEGRPHRPPRSLCCHRQEKRSHEAYRRNSIFHLSYRTNPRESGSRSIAD